MAAEFEVGQVWVCPHGANRTITEVRQGPDGSTWIDCVYPTDNNGPINSTRTARHTAGWSRVL